MNRLKTASILGGGAALAGWIAWGVYSSQTTETARYDTLLRLEGTEIRTYPETVLVETEAPDQVTAFRRLFAYISGENDGGESLAMTAPVRSRGGPDIPMPPPLRSRTTDADDGGVEMGFVLPAEYTPETAPEPTDSAVRLRTEDERTVAARRFSWYAPQVRVDRQQRKLLSTLHREGIEPVGEPYLLRYDDPWTPPFMRRNEVAVEIAETF